MYSFQSSDPKRTEYQLEFDKIDNHVEVLATDSVIYDKWIDQQLKNADSTPEMDLPKFPIAFGPSFAESLLKQFSVNFMFHLKQR